MPQEKKKINTDFSLHYIYLVSFGHQFRLKFTENPLMCKIIYGS